MSEQNYFKLQATLSEAHAQVCQAVAMSSNYPFFQRAEYRDKLLKLMREVREVQSFIGAEIDRIFPVPNPSSEE